MKPFQGASQASDWMDANCASCKNSAAKGGACPIEQSLLSTHFELFGEVPDLVAALMGAGTYPAHETWICPERKP